MKWCAAFLVVISFTCSVSAKNIPEGWPICKRNDPNLNACMLAATDTMREILVTKGAKEFGFPPLSSFVIPQIKIQQEITPNIIIDLTQTNVSVEGMETYKFTEFSFNPTTLIWAGKVGFDYLHIKGGLDFNGKLFGNDLKEHGSGVISIAKPTADFSLDGKIIQKKGKDYYHVESTSVKLHVDPRSVEFKDAINISPRLIQSINGVLADESGDNLKSVLKATEDVVAGLLKSLIGNIPEKVPYDKLFPPM